FQSQVALLLDARPPRVVDKVTEVVAEESMLDTDRFAAGQMRLIGSEYLSNIVESDLHLDKGLLAGRLIATIDPRSHVITFEIHDLDAKQAERYVDAFASAYIATTIAQRTARAPGATSFLVGHDDTLRN